MDSTNKYLKDNWWMFLVQGLIALVFGIITVISPETSLVWLILVFSLFMIFGGIIDVIVGITSIGKRTFWPVNLVMGVLQAGIGVYLIQRPTLTAAIFLIYVALSLLFRGILELASAFETGLHADLRALHIVGGALSIFASIVIWRYPVAGALAFVWVLGLYAILAGPVLISFALKARDA